MSMFGRHHHDDDREGWSEKRILRRILEELEEQTALLKIISDEMKPVVAKVPAQVMVKVG